MDEDKAYPTGLRKEVVINKREMLTSWYFYKPILILLSCIGTVVGIGAAIEYFSLGDILMTAAAISIAAGIVFGIFYGLYSLGRMFYKEHMTVIRNNYEELTNQPWDVDEPIAKKNSRI